MIDTSATYAERSPGRNRDRAVKRVSFSWLDPGEGIKTVSMPLCKRHYEDYLQWKPFLTKCHREIDVDERYCGKCLSADNVRGSHQ